ncbi:hypothetical protein QAD02_006899, partial [Eretmocerus hayati]
MPDFDTTYIHTPMFHGRLSDQEIRLLFHRDRAQIPPYRTARLNTHLPLRSKREIRPVEIDLAGVKTHLKLSPLMNNVVNIINFPVWIMQKDGVESDNFTLHRLNQNESAIDGSFYGDSEKMAVMLGYSKDREIYYDGVFGNSSTVTVVRSIAEKWWRESADIGDHIIYDVDEDVNTTISTDVNSQNTELMGQPLKIMYPKLLIFVENSFFKQLGENVKETINYVSIFWNAVNMKYSELPSPKVRIKVTGIIIEKDESSLSCIHESWKNDTKPDIDTMKMLLGCGRAFRGSICMAKYNSGFIHDDGNYDGVQTAAHELGHLLNLPHDGMEGAEECDGYPEDGIGTMMAPFKTS